MFIASRKFKHLDPCPKIIRWIVGESNLSIRSPDSDLVPGVVLNLGKVLRVVGPGLGLLQPGPQQKSVAGGQQLVHVRQQLTQLVSCSSVAGLKILLFYSSNHENAKSL